MIYDRRGMFARSRGASNDCYKNSRMMLMIVDGRWKKQSIGNRATSKENDDRIGEQRRISTAINLR